MVFVKTARAVVDTVDRLRSGWRFGGRQLIRGSFRLYTWQQTRSPLPVDSHRVHPTLLAAFSRFRRTAPHSSTVRISRRPEARSRRLFTNASTYIVHFNCKGIPITSLTSISG
jgi:hypothetical protein